MMFWPNEFLHLRNCLKNAIKQKRGKLENTLQSNIVINIIEETNSISWDKR